MESELLRGLVGEEISSVIFVRDYLQLDFDGHRLTCNVWPAVNTGETHLACGEQGYRDSLCARIGIKVVAVIDSDGQVRLDFQDGAALAFDLVNTETPEGDRLVFRSRSDQWGWW